jgi:2-dehydropantoate 2-reductase
MTRVAVLGAGAVGGFVAGALARAGVATTLIAREETTAAIASHGLRIASARMGRVVAHPTVAPRLVEPVDVLILATRAGQLDAALERLEQAPGLVVPLLSGVDHVAALRERFGPRTVAATIALDSERVAPGVIVQASPSVQVELAADHPSARPRLAAVRDLLRAAEIPARLGDSEARVLWRALVVDVAVSLTTAAYGRSIGAVRDHPRGRLELEEAVDEATAVANAEGAALDGDAALRAVWALDPERTSALARDVAAGRPDELDATAGAVLRHGAAGGLACPTTAALVARVRATAIGTLKGDV